MALHAQAELASDAVPAARVSVAGLLRAYRGVMREYLVVPGPGQSLRDRLAGATVDLYQRRSKASRDYPRKKQEKPIGAPKIRPATPQEVEQAKRIKIAHKLRLTA